MKRELRLLMVEDVALDAELIQHELHRAGLRFRARRVESREAFLRELEQHPPDLILSDHGMPAFDGFMALETARQHCPEVPFIFVTGAHGDEVAVETLKRGADDYVLKSRLHRLASCVNRVLAQAAARAQHRRSLEQEAAEEAERRAEAKVRHQYAQLQADYQELQELTSRLGLALRSPLRQLDTLAERLSKSAGERLDPKEHKSLKAIAESARQMSHLLDELLTFSRIGQVQMYHLRFSLAEVVQEVIQELRRETEGRMVEWTVGPLPEVTGDPNLLGKAFTRLLSNALKFTAGQTPARIRIGSRTTQSEVIIFVTDNGVGFAPHRSHQLFGIFQRLHPAEEFPGLGLGLAEVRRIVQRHGGRTWAEGAPNQGATFSFSLPRPDASLPEEPAEA